MPITIGSNIASLHTQRTLSKSAEQLARVYERLSSGQRINHASDDAAGLAIAMRLNSDARVSSQAIRNVNDSLSLISVSESALTALESITIRHRELAQEAANGTYSSQQRAALDQEARALTNEYNRVVLTTKFNNLSLFSTSWDIMSTQAGAGSVNSIGFQYANELSTKLTGGSYFSISSSGAGSYYVWFTLDGQGTDPGQAGTGVRVDLSSTPGGGVGTIPGTPGSAYIDFTDFNGGYDSDAIYISTPTSSYYVWFNIDGAMNDPLDPVSLGATGIKVNISSGASGAAIANAVAAELAATGEFTTSHPTSTSLTITNTQAGMIQYGFFDYFANFANNQISWGTDPSSTTLPGLTSTEVQDAVATALQPYFSFSRSSEGALLFNQSLGAVTIDPGTAGNVVADSGSSGSAGASLAFGDGRGMTLVSQIDLSSVSGARNAITTLDSRLVRILAQAAIYGSTQSRFEVALATLTNQSENYKAAFGRIMDADIASESAMLMKQQILQKAGAAILAQANQMPTLVLKLLE